MWRFGAACCPLCLLFIPLFLKGTNRKNTSDVVAEERWLPSPRELLQMGRTFTAVTIAWVFFRADSVGIAMDYLMHSCQALGSIPNRPSLTLLTFIMVLTSLDFWNRNSARNPMALPRRWVRWPLYCFVAFEVLQRFSNPASFIYFQF